MDGEVERTDPEPARTLAGTLASGPPILPGEVPARGAEIGRYLVTGEIGRGAMGAVLAAYDADLDRKVAIKLIGEPLGADEERRRRLLGEAKSMARIAHPNVVTVFDAGVWHDRLWVAMELIDGVTLDRWRASTPRTSAEIVATFVSAGRGLAAAHDAGVLHGDFKPSNVLVASSGRVVVADFGLANPLARAGTPDVASSSPMGTPAYMSPEHYLGDAIDARSDQFAFCVALFEQLAGGRPFQGRSLVELAATISEGTIDAALAATIPARVRAVVLRGLSRRPANRFASMHELVAALQSAGGPRWRVHLALLAASFIGATTWLLARSEETSLCEPGIARVQAFWNTDSRALVAVHAEGMTPAAAELRADHLRDGIDGYLGEWTELYDRACDDGAQRSAELPQHARVACLENRLAAGRGLVELVGREPIEATRVDGLLEGLPDLAECRGPAFGRWEPVPADPEAAREVASLRQRLADARLRRRAGAIESVAPEVAAVLAAARESGLSHVVAEALLEQAAVSRAGNDAEGADAAVDEALTVALRDGHDYVASRAINRRLLLMQEDPSLRLSEAVQWARLGETLAARAGAGPRSLGDFPNNLCIIRLHHSDLAGALADCGRAEQLYAEESGPDAREAIGARVNRATVLVEMQRFAEAEPLLRDAAARYDEMLGREHTDAITVVWHLAQLQGLSGNRREALSTGKDAMQRRLAAGGPYGRAARRAFVMLAHLYAGVGDMDAAHEALANARKALAIDEAHAYDTLYVEAAIAARSRDDARAIELYTRFLELEVLPLQRDRARLNRAQMQLLRGNDDAALADATFVCGDGAPRAGQGVALFCYVLGGLAASALGDPLAATRWLAWAESVIGQDFEEARTRRLLRFVIGGRRDPESIAAIRADRDALFQRGDPDDPGVRMFDRWLSPTPPGPMPGALARPRAGRTLDTPVDR